MRIDSQSVSSIDLMSPGWLTASARKEGMLDQSSGEGIRADDQPSWSGDMGQEVHGAILALISILGYVLLRMWPLMVVP
jgi:hypothetical protein